MTGLEVFRFDGAEVRTVVIDGEPWFVLADVVAALGLVRSASAVADRLDDGVRQTYPILDSLGRTQRATVISEPGVYEVAIRSDAPSARTFRTWLTREVIPAIRRTGSYSAPVSEDEIVHRALAITARRVEALSARVAELEPVAAHAETFRQADGLRTIADVANDFKAHCATHFPGVKVLHRDVYEHAGRLGLIIRGNTVRHNQPTAQAIEADWARPHRHTYDTNSHGAQTSVSARLTPRGEARLWDGLAAWLGAHGTLAVAL